MITRSYSTAEFAQFAASVYLKVKRDDEDSQKAIASLLNQYKWEKVELSDGEKTLVEKIKEFVESGIRLWIEYKAPENLQVHRKIQHDLSNALELYFSAYFASLENEEEV